jgi:hypothetical protein
MWHTRRCSVQHPGRELGDWVCPILGLPYFGFVFCRGSRAVRFATLVQLGGLGLYGTQQRLFYEQSVCINLSALP